MTRRDNHRDELDDGSVRAVARLFADARVRQFAALGSSLWYRAELASGLVAWTAPLLTRWGYEADDAAEHINWWLDRTHPNDVALLTALLGQARTGARERWELRYRFRKADGDWVRVAGRATLVRDPVGRPVATQGSVVEVARTAKLVPTLCDVCAVVHHFAPIATRLLGGDIVYATFAEGEAMVMADAVQLEQVLLTLVVDARDAIRGPGRVSITVSRVHLTLPFGHAHGMVPVGEWVRFRVADSGDGIHPFNLPHLVEPLLPTQPGRGNSRGVATVLSIVQTWNGQVVVDSLVGEGTAISCYLPAA